jgi:aminoglycoside phosphotransferase (APT) family kinase protein
LSQAAGHEIDLDDENALVLRLEAFLAGKLDRGIHVIKLRRFAVGYSWITYGFSIAAPGIGGITDLILRLGPSYGLFAPYSAAPEFLSLKAIEGGGVPAPKAYFWSDDATIMGAPFCITELVRGDAPIPWGAAGNMADELRQTLASQFIDAVAALHNTEWQNSGLAELGTDVTVANAAGLQIQEWEHHYRRWALRAYPMFELALQWAKENRPLAPRVSIIHGDYRLGNFLAVGDRITAILDWELVHLGDPHEDLAWICLPQYRGGTNLMSRLVTRENLYARYQAKTGLAINEQTMKFYEIFSLIKLAATHMAAVSVFERNGFHDMRMPAMGTQIAPVLRQIEKALEVMG